MPTSLGHSSMLLPEFIIDILLPLAAAVKEYVLVGMGVGLALAALRVLALIENDWAKSGASSNIKSRHMRMRTSSKPCMMRSAAADSRRARLHTSGCRENS